MCSRAAPRNSCRADYTGGDYPGAVMTREEQVKAVGLKAGARVVGIAVVEAFAEKVPAGYPSHDRRAILS